MIPNDPETLNRKYDAVVVGTGSAGGVLTKELTDRGMKVLALEAGAYYESEDFAPFEDIYTSERFWSGGFEADRLFRMIFIRGKGVGGSTLVNQCLINRFPDDVFERWSSISGKRDLNGKTIEPYYDKVESEMQIDQLGPEDFNGNNEMMRRGMDACGYRWKTMRRGQTNCKDCIHCLGGCPLGSKQGTNVTFIPRARKTGATILANCEVERVALANGGRPNRIFAQLEGRPCTIEAPTLVLAGGTLGTTQILLRSGLKDRLPALGENFACHPQRVVFGEFTENLHGIDGAFQAIASDDERFYKSGFKLESVFGPPLTASIALGGFGSEHKGKMQRLFEYGVIEIACRDESTGKVSLDKKGKLVIDKPLTDLDDQKLIEGVRVTKEIMDAAGAKSTAVVDQEVGLHLMGTCRMGESPITSVVDHNWRIHGTERAFVCDASVFPASTCVNIMDTVMAQAAMAAEEIAA